MLSSKRSWLSLIIGVTVLALPTVAAGQGDDELARVHFQAAASYYERGEYEDALREFERSHALSGRSQLFYNLSLTHQQLGNLAESVDFLSRYLARIDHRPTRSGGNL